MWGIFRLVSSSPSCKWVPALSRGDKTTVCAITTVVQVGLCVSTPQLVGAVQCSCEYLTRLHEFVIAQAQSSLSCAQGPQSLTGGAWPLAAAPYICRLCVCVRVCVCV